VSGRDALPARRTTSSAAIRRSGAATCRRTRRSIPERLSGIDLVYLRQPASARVTTSSLRPERIRARSCSASRARTNSRSTPEGDLVLHAIGGTYASTSPSSIRKSTECGARIAGGYVRKGAGRVGFEVAAYDTTRPLVIDPVVLSYSTTSAAAAFGNADDATSLQSTRTATPTSRAPPVPTTSRRTAGQSGPLSPGAPTPS